ncbi:MAG: hypothetical protein ABEJ80_02445 [Halarchaeum sp.]
MGRSQESGHGDGPTGGGERADGAAYRPERIEESLTRGSHATRWLRDRFGDALRTVLVYDESVNEYTHLADRVDDQYTDGELDRIAREHGFRDALTGPHFESLFHLGDTTATVTRFEDGTLVQVPFDDATGVVITVESGTPIDLDELVGALRTDYRPEFVSTDG